MTSRLSRVVQVELDVTHDISSRCPRDKVNGWYRRGGQERYIYKIQIEPCADVAL